MMETQVDRELLEKIADLIGKPVGAFNIRKDCGCDGRESTEHIKIDDRTDGHAGIDIRILDGTKEVSFSKVYFGAAMNLPYEGGGFRFCPDARCRDGRLDIIVLANLPKFKVLSLLPTAFWGLHTRFRGVYTYTCRSVEFISDRELAVHTDGEPVLYQKRLKVCLEKEKLPVKIINK